MYFKKQLPNIVTSLNLLSGIIAVFYAVFGKLEVAAFFVVLGIVFDFFDGFLARILNVQGALGKQLDSLADLITSGLVPGIFMFHLLLRATTNTPIEKVFTCNTFELLPFIGLLIPLASAYRLANFNIDTRQMTSFIGLPTPANALLIISLPLIIRYSSIEFFVKIFQNSLVLTIIILLSTYLLNAPIALFALKFTNYSWKENRIRYLFLGFSLLMIVGLQFASVPLIIVSYLVFSFWNNRL